ncbi:putative baseplate assembly protein [bacterium]|nr:putative baseplate assembly protein [bacterium]
MADQPQLYRTKNEDLAQSIQFELAQTGWATQPNGVGTALIHLFGRLVQIIAHRLNQTPRQHFRAFLNEAGIDLAVPRAARTELTFTPASDGPALIQVPARTQVATRPTPSQPEIIFETDEDLTVIPAQLAHCIVLDRVNYSDRSAEAGGSVAGEFAAFRGETERERVLLIGDDRLFTFDDENSRRHATFTLTFSLARPGTPNQDGWRVHWCYWDGAEWRELGACVEDGTANLAQSDDVLVHALPDDALAYTLHEGVVVWLAARLSGGNARTQLPLIQRIAMRRTIHVEDEIPAKIDAIVTATQSGTVLAALDENASFLPLGAYPLPLDAFYLRLDEALSKPGARVTLDLALDEIAAKLSSLDEATAPHVAWEYYSDKGWTLLGESRRGCPDLARRNFEDNYPSFAPPTLVRQPLTRRKFLEFEIPPSYYDQELPAAFDGGKQITDIYSRRRYVQIAVPEACSTLPAQDLIYGAYRSEDGFGFRDGTCALTTPGIVRFTLPPRGDDKRPSPVRTEIGDQKGYWLRVRLVSGGYAVPQSATGPLDALRNLVSNPYAPPVTTPPVLQQITVRYGHFEIADPAADDAPKTVTDCISVVDQRERVHGQALRDGKSFAPFTAATESETLLLGFKPLDAKSSAPAFPPGQWIQLRINVPGEEIAALHRARLKWSYWDGSRWRPLAVVDGTAAFQRTGVVGFFAPEHHGSSYEFGFAAYWLRVQPASPNHRPRLEALRLNSVSATNAQTIESEILGSGNGEAHQLFRLTRTPVLRDDVVVEVFEPDQRRKESAGEETTMSPAAAATTGEERRGEGEWMAWTATASFYTAGAEDRVFILDCISGEIRFGDGKRGKIPPPGTENVRARRYRVHNADAGNVAANSVNVLRNPGVELSAVRSVTNLIPAAGGSAIEKVEQVEERGPYRIKNRGRAVTVEDYTWLARDVEGVERAHCLPTYNARGETQPGWVSVVVTPQTSLARSDEEAKRKPIAGAILLQQVRQRLQAQALTNLKDRMPTATEGATEMAAADEDRILVKAAPYLEVTVHAQVTPRRPEDADQVRHAVIQQLETFLHPTHGGPDGAGWQSGRDVYLSEVAAEIEGVPGVDYVGRIALRCTSQQQQILHVGWEALPWALPAGSLVSTIDEQIKLSLAEGLPQESDRERPKDIKHTQLSLYGFNQAAPIEVITLRSDGSWHGERRRAAQVMSSGRVLSFQVPLEFAQRAHFIAWSAADPTLISADRQVRLPVYPALLSIDGNKHVRLYSVIVPFAGEALSSANTAILVGDDASMSAEVAWKSETWDEDGFTLRLTEPLHFADVATYDNWRLQRPALHSDDGRIRLPVAPLDLEQGETVLVHALRVCISAAALNGMDGAALEMAENAPPEAIPLQTVRKIAGVSARDFAIFFDTPIHFAGGARLADWCKAFPALISGDHRVRLPLRTDALAILAGQETVGQETVGQETDIELWGAGLRTPGNGDLVSLTHRERRRRRVKFRQVQGVGCASNTTRIFVPADYLICSGNHQIEMSLEAADADFTA